MGHLTLFLPTLAALWLGWRLWSFTLWPWLHPEVPKRYPYLIPVVGHIRAMIKHTGKVFTQGRKYFSNSREIFSLVVMGEELYIVTNPLDIQAIFKQPDRLDHDAMAVDILLDLGLTQQTIDQIFKPSHGPKNYIQATHDNFRTQLHPGDHLQNVQAKFLGHIDTSLRFDKIDGPGIRAMPNGSKVVSLWEWCGQVLVDSAIESIFSRSLYDFEPDLLKEFFIFDEQSWKLPYRLPQFAAKDMYSSMNKCITAISKWLELPVESRQAAWIVDRMVQGLDELGITDGSQRGAMVFVLFRLVNTNAYRLCFWCLAHLVFDTELLNEIKEEMRPAWTETGDGTLNMNYLTEKCPLLSSFYDEVLRLTVDSIGARVVVRQTKIGNKILSPGRKVLMPFRQGHFDQAVFGEDANAFNPRRFYNNEGLSRSPSWKPFGGGLAWCPGRFMARREVYMFLGIVLFRLDVTLYSPNYQTPQFPVPDETYPYGGILAPKPGEGVLVEICRKA